MPPVGHSFLVASIALPDMVVPPHGANRQHGHIEGPRIFVVVCNRPCERSVNQCRSPVVSIEQGPMPNHTDIQEIIDHFPQLGVQNSVIRRRQVVP